MIALTYLHSLQRCELVLILLLMITRFLFPNNLTTTILNVPESWDPTHEPIDTF
jgi:hypothetical protein